MNELADLDSPVTSEGRSPRRSPFSLKTLSPDRDDCSESQRPERVIAPASLPRGRPRFPIGLLLPAALGTAWALAARFDWLDRSLLPTPTDVCNVFVRLVREGELQQHLSITLRRVALGFLLGGSVATLLGTLTGYWTLARRLLDPTLQALRSLPSLAWSPLFLLWLGIDETSKVALIALGVFFPVYLGLMNGIQNVDRKLVEVGLAHGFGSVALVRRVFFPATLPAFLISLRTGLSVGWMFVVAAELLGASRGLGFLLIDGQTTGRPALMLVSIGLFAASGKGTDVALAALNRRLLRWQDVYHVGNT